jgi:hypothetical protein
MITIAQAKNLIGKPVNYQPRKWVPDEVLTAMAGTLKGTMEPVGKPEHGVITGANDQYIFVQFDGDSGAKACYPGTLDLTADQPKDA